MIFRRIVLCALLVGALSGLLLSVVQQFGVLPIIAAAEALEAAGVPSASAHDAHEAHDAAGAHAHDESTWTPADGAERQIWTIVANSLTAIGFALLLIAAIAARESLTGLPRARLRNGMLWGAAGYLCVFALPALGLPPEIPGASAPELGARQQWWLLAVACGAGGLSGLAFLRGAARWAAPALLAVPFVVGAPHLAVGAFSGYSPEVALRMEDLAQRFVWATALTNAAYWLALGALSGWAAGRWVGPALRPGGAPVGESA